MNRAPLQPDALPISADPAANVSYVVATASDFEELLALRIAAMQESLERVGRFDPARARERFERGFSPRHTRHIVVEGSRVGFIVLKPAEQCLMLDHLYVLPGYQGRGIGAAVLAQIFKEADQLACSVRVGALRDSDSNRFYLRHGFHQIGEDEWDMYYVRPIKSKPPTG
jgi:GNAT superfamily N-acetyltransferase